MTDFRTALDSLGDTPFRAYLYPFLYLDETPFDDVDSLQDALRPIHAIRTSSLFPEYVNLEDSYNQYLALIQDRETGEYHGHGFTCLLDNLQAAFLDVKLRHLPDWIDVAGNCCGRGWRDCGGGNGRTSCGQQADRESKAADPDRGQAPERQWAVSVRSGHRVSPNH